MKSKFPSDSFVTKTEIVCPNDSNPMGILQGGRLVEWMDIAAAVTAQKHAEKICVTVSIEKIAFLKAAKIGDIVIIKSRITRAFNSSMEIFVEAFTRKIFEQNENLISSAFFRFVAIDSSEKPIQVFPVNPVTESDILLFNEALVRKNKLHG